jgi:hypothetical protein
MSAVDAITKNTLDALSSASSFFNNSDSSEEDEQTEKEVQKICRRRSMLMPPSRPSLSLRKEEETASRIPLRDTMKELDDVVATFPLPPTGIGQSLPPAPLPSSAPPPAEKGSALKAVSGGLMSMKNLFAERWGKKN